MQIPNVSHFAEVPITIWLKQHDPNSWKCKHVTEAARLFWPSGR